MTSMTGLCTLASGEADSGLERIIRLRLTPDCLTVQEEVVSQEGSTNQFDQSGLPVLREISLCRDHRGSFGFSVRGGSENRLPVLVSHVQKGMPAFKTKALFIGDAILRIDQASVEGATHDEVVERLKNAGQQVTLVVKHFREAAKLLHEQAGSSNSTASAGRAAGSGATSANRRDSSRRTSSNAAVTSAPESPPSLPPPPPQPSQPQLRCSSSEDLLLDPVVDEPAASSAAARLNLGGFSIGGAFNNNRSNGEIVDDDLDGFEAGLAPPPPANPWVLRTPSAGGATIAEARAPIASESFSTVRSNSSTGSGFWQQQHQTPTEPPPQLPPPPPPLPPPPAARHSRSSSTSSKASLLAPTNDTDRCTVFANRNANSSRGSGRNHRRSQQVGDCSLTEAWQQQNHCQQPQRPCQERSWIDVMTVPLKYGRVTRYQPNSDQLRRCSFEVVGLNGHSTGCLLFSSFEEFNKWFSVVHSNIRQLMELEVSRFNERIGTDFPPKTEPLLYMGWLGLTLHDSPQLSRLWQDVFLALRGDDLMLFEVPPIFLDDWKSASVKEKVYKCVIRVLDDEELLDKRLNAFFLHCGSAHTFYMSAETVGDVSRLERCWFRATSNSLAKKSAVGSPVLFKVSHNGQEGQLVFDLDKGISFAVGQQCLWTYRFACLKRSYDDRDRKLFLHFQDPGSSTSLLTDAATTSSTADGCVSGVAIVKEVEVPDLQLLLIVLHSFLSSKLTAVDPQFLKP